MAQRDPNRFADGLEAASIRARLEREETELSVLRQNLDFAEQSFRDVDARFREAEKIYYEHKALRNDASAYVDIARRKWDEQQTTVATQRAYFHPIRKAPLEVLGRVCEIGLEDLLHGVLDWQALAFDVLQEQRRLPFTLSSVCRRWRTACLTAPRAWAHVILSFSEITSERAPAWSAYLDLALSRSSASPLMLTLHRTQGRLPRDHDNDIVTKILQHMSRCIQFHMLVHRLHTNDAFFPLLSASAPRLRRIYIDVDRDCTNRLHSVVGFPTSKQVEVVFADNFFGFSDAVLSSAREMTLGHAVCDDVRNDLLRIVRKASTLDLLRLNFPLLPNGINFVSPHALKPLRTLILEVAGDCPMPSLLHMISLPNLKDLTLHGDEASTGTRLEFLGTVSSTCTLFHLGISASDPALASRFCSALQQIKTLRSLNIYESNFTTDAMRTFCRTLLPTNDTKACPYLRVVEFDTDCSFEPDCDPDEFLDLVRARQAADRGTDGMEWWISKFTVGGWDRPGRGGLQAELDELLLPRDEPHVKE